MLDSAAQRSSSCLTAQRSAAHSPHLYAVLLARLKVHPVKACAAQRNQLHTTLRESLNHLAAAAAAAGQQGSGRSSR
jgi:hypothetical protein